MDQELTNGFSPQNCPACKAENEADANFCESCGAVLKPVLICESCKAENDAEAKFCDQCGKELDTPEYRAKQSLKLKVGLTLLAIGFLILVLIVIHEMKTKKGDLLYGLSTKDGRFLEEIKKRQK